jgi:hypothetical protein
MAEVNVENMEENEALFMEKMGFARDTEGLELSDDQLVNFLLLCHQMEYGITRKRPRRKASRSRSSRCMAAT